MFRNMISAAIIGMVTLFVASCGSDAGGGGQAKMPPPAISFVTQTLVAASQGHNYAAAIDIQGGTEQGHAWSVVSGSLPNGIALSPTGQSATLAGTPTVFGTFNFEIEVVDSGGMTASQTFDLTVSAAPTLTITTLSVPNGTELSSYSTTVAASGGSGSGYQWSITAGALPTGLAMATTGTPDTTISGTLASAGSYSFTVTVTDSLGLVANRAYQMTVSALPALSITTTSLANGTQGTAYSETLTASGGTGAGYAWSVLNGALPNGLTLGASGTPSSGITGIPSTGGTFNFTIQVEDSNGTTATQALQIDVTPVPLSIVSAPNLPDGTEGVSYSATITGAGGDSGSYAWSVVHGDLPPGLILNQGSPSATLTGSPTAFGRWHFTVELTDSTNATVTQDVSAIVVVTATADSWPTTFSLALDRGGSVVFTGSKIIQFGGEFTSSNQGEVMTPGLGTSVGITTTGAPKARQDHTAVWTGRKMIVFGGRDGTTTYYRDGFSYDPWADAWTPISSVNAPAARANHTAIWTGTEMVVFGGHDGSNNAMGSGAAYDPATDTWRTLAPLPGTINPRERHKAIWTGTHMIVWGGYSGGSEVYDGGMYDPSTDQWSPITATGAPEVKAEQSAVHWTGTKLFVWGGHTLQPYMDGGEWDPSTNTWSALGTWYIIRRTPASCATSTGVFVWGGLDHYGTVAQNDGEFFDYSINNWQTMASTSLSARFNAKAFWTGRQVIVWGGKDFGFAGTNPQSDGAVYQP